MNRFVTTFACATGFGLLASCASPPPPSDGPMSPELDIDPSRHGNLAAAQELSRQAYDTITVAQRDNQYELGGHAARAKEILREVNNELRLAADAANRR